MYVQYIDKLMNITGMLVAETGNFQNQHANVFAQELLSGNASGAACAWLDSQFFEGVLQEDILHILVHPPQPDNLSHLEVLFSSLKFS